MEQWVRHRYRLDGISRPTPTAGELISAPAVSGWQAATVATGHAAELDGNLLPYRADT